MFSQTARVIPFILCTIAALSFMCGRAGAGESNVFLVGDSVLSALNPNDTNYAQAIIAKDQWHVSIDAKPCRCATTPGCKGGTPESVKNVLTKRGDLSSSVVVIMVGHNDMRNASFRSKVADILEVAKKSPMVFWVTMREISQSYRVANGILAEEANKRKNVRLVHWETQSNGQPSWFARDGVHLKTQGARMLAQAILHDLNDWRSKSKGGAQNNSFGSEKPKDERITSISEKSSR